MKIKNLFLFIFVGFFLCCPCFGVKADEVVHIGHSKQSNEPNHSYIYLINSFKISSSNDTISMGGYSYISHQDNRGALGSVTGNLSTWIIAYSGEWKDEYLNCSSSNSNCYKKKATPTAVDHYAFRCQSNATCRVSARASTNSQTTFDEYGSECVSNGSDCMYNNIGFKISINLNTVYKRMKLNESSKDLKFRIYSKTGKHYASADVGFYRGFCKKDGNACSTSVSTKSYVFNINDMSDTGYFDAANAYVQDSAGDNYVGVDFFVSGVDYKILDYSKDAGRKLNWNVGESEGLSLPGDVIFRLAGNNYSGTVSPAAAGNGDGSYWTYATWFKVRGSFKISQLKPNYIKKECSDYYPNLTDKKKNEVDCGESGDYEQCVKTTNVSGNIYIKVADAKCATSSNKIKEGDNYYVTVDVKTDVLYHQKATFSFGSISPQEVYAGKGFSLGNTTYNSTITWINANSTAAGTPHYTYDASLYVPVNDRCVLDNDFDVTEAETYYYYNRSGNFVSGNLSEASFSVIDKAARTKIKTKNVKNIKFKSCDSNNLDNCSTDSPTFSVSGGWSKAEDTNVSAYKVENKRFGTVIAYKYKYDLADSYIEVSGSKLGKAIYGELADSEASKYQATGQKYYIEYRWTSSRGAFPFNLVANINLSLLSNMRWELNGTCGITVKDGLFKDGPSSNIPDDPGEDSGGNSIVPNFVYRSINLEDPFPKAANKNEVPANWREWYCGNSSGCGGSNVNKIRLSKTYDNYPEKPLYEVNLVETGDDGLKISSVKNYTDKSYTDTSGINKDGTSDFITKSFERYFKYPTVGGKSFCKVGYFDTSCDLVS